MNERTLRDNWEAIHENYLADEKQLLKRILLVIGHYDADAIRQRAVELVTKIRQQKDTQSLVDEFLHEYQLNSEEGIVLLCIAEALLRIPDSQTQDLFLQEKLTEADWDKHLQHSGSLRVNLSTQALLISSKLESKFNTVPDHRNVFDELVARLGLPVIRNALKQAMQYLAYQFVFAETIEQATQQARQLNDYLFSFDMLGEAALTANDAERYFNAYAKAIQSLAAHRQSAEIYFNHSISIKLSALCPRYEPFQHQRAIKELTGKLLTLSVLAREAEISVTIDAEETERLEMSLLVFQQLLSSPALKNWSGLGLAVQAYQKRAVSVIGWLASLAKYQHCKIPVRLVKGAYWDREIKRTQLNGLEDYPVFTHKTATDVCFLACAKQLLSQPECFYPQFATHNAHTVAAILEMGNNHPGFEFQRLHGMGEQLHRETLSRTQGKVPCRIYAPVGIYQDLLPYLVRRLLENGANTSFVNQLENPDIAIEQVIDDPVLKLKHSGISAGIVLPKDLFLPRKNSAGLNIDDLQQLDQLQDDLKRLEKKKWFATPLVNGQAVIGSEHVISSPFDHRKKVGSVVHSDKQTIVDAVKCASNEFESWRLSSAAKRAEYLLSAADLLEQNRLELVSLCIREGGKTLKEALDEIREAVDYCRYYAIQAKQLFSRPEKLPGPTGEENILRYFGRGLFVCISPWNFPVAIFIGQIAAALAAGNVVIAKPAELTSLTAFRCIEILHQAGMPGSVLQFLPGKGGYIGGQLLSDERIAGVAFTGSTTTASLINQQLAKLSAIPVLIAETGGQNVMISDSSAHPEQLVQDVLVSAFNSAGQRCSALRVLYIPHQVAEKTIAMLIGAMRQLVIGSPEQYHNDVGPVISHQAAQQLSSHLEQMLQNAELLYQCDLSDQSGNGSYFPPSLVEIKSIKQLTKEVFGPVLHIVRYDPADLDTVIKDINDTGYGLTLGIHSRVKATINKITEQAKVGNVYVNRNTIGAVVGAQPFGGMGLSGTGPKAGGPNYLQRFAVEQTVTTNTAAIGGNVMLMTQNLT